jgi:universal stress protein E
MDIIKITTILDKPKHDQVAWRRTLELQKQSGASVEAVSFVWNAMCENSSALNAADRRKLRRGLIEQRKAWLHKMAGKAPAAKVRERSIYGHDIANWVADDLSKKKPDLLVKTVHKSGSLVHTPTDWELLRSCPVPVLLTSKRRGKPSGNIVAALDLRNLDTKHRHLNCKVLEAAHCFAELSGARVHVVFAVEISQVLRDLDIVNETVSKKKVVKKITPELERLLKPYQISKSRIHMPVGKAGRVVAQVSRKVNADLLVIGSSAHRAKQLVGFGTSAERIVTKTACDVLAVHPD